MSTPPFLVFNPRGSGSAVAALDAPKLRGFKGPTRRCVINFILLCILSSVIPYYCAYGLTEIVLDATTHSHRNITAPLSMPSSAALFEEVAKRDVLSVDDEILQRINPRWNSGEYVESAVVVDLARTVGWLVQTVRKQTLERV